MDNLENRTPAEIDAVLNDLGFERAKAISRAEAFAKLAHDYAEPESPRRRPDPQQAKFYEGKAAEERVKAQELAGQIAPLNAEYDRRGGWPRAFLVQNSGGHVHGSMGCSTCFPSTQYAWLTDYSGKGEDEIVYAAGELACTVCYPSAPVDVLKRVGEIRRPSDLERERIAAEKAAKDAEKAAAAVVDPESGDVLYKTERAALNAIGSALKDIRWYEFKHPDQSKWEALAGKAVNALAARRGVDPADLMAELTAKADKANAAGIRKAWRELKADCANGRWTPGVINMDSATVRYGKSIGEELVFSRQD
ncbi:hypothetical protein ACFV6Y_39105 [Streptomyces massasporeus]|uniref:hypothetical protein n=1 Tax=Streptomyces massasporeus TaxID=67324 RepID=UPI00366155F7